MPNFMVTASHEGPGRRLPVAAAKLRAFAQELVIRSPTSMGLRADVGKVRPDDTQRRPYVPAVRFYAALCAIGAGLRGLWGLWGSAGRHGPGWRAGERHPAAVHAPPRPWSPVLGRPWGARARAIAQSIDIRSDSGLNG